MALIICPECKKEHTDTIESCPHCGYKRHSTPTKQIPVKPKKKRKDTWVIWILVILFGIMILYVGNVKREREAYKSEKLHNDVEELLNEDIDELLKDYRYVYKVVNLRSGPGTDNTIIGKINRGEKIELLSEEGNWAKIKKSSGEEGYVYSEFLKYSPIPDIEIVDWSWRVDPDFGSDGTIIWIVELRNNTSRYIDMVRVEITIYDGNNRVTETDFQFVQGLAPGRTASAKSYATYYGTEKTARIRVVD